MLSAHYATVSSPVHPHPHQTPLHGHNVPMLSSHPGQQAQYAHQHAGISSLLPTPPSSPPSIGMYPVESTISLLESLVAFYHQERMWVYRTRAHLEMDFLHRASDSQSEGSVTTDAGIDDDSDLPGQLQSQSPDSGKTADGTSPSPPTKWLKRKKAFNLKLEGISSRSMLPPVARGGISKRPHHTQHRARHSSNLNPASVPASSHQNAMHGPTSAALHPHQSVPAASSSSAVSFYPPTNFDAATTLTSPYLSHPSFQFSAIANQQSLTPAVGTPQFTSTSSHHAHPSMQQAQSQPGPFVLGAGGREPSMQILEMFERMMQARMESCERVTRMVREANKPGGVSIGSVGGPVGGFGGPAGLPVAVGAQGIAAEYSQSQGAGMVTTKTATEQGFGTGVNME